MKKEIEMIDIRFVKQAGWKETKIKGINIFYTGSKKVIDNLIKILYFKNFVENRIRKFLLDDNRNCSFIIKAKNIFYILQQVFVGIILFFLELTIRN